MYNLCFYPDCNMQAVSAINGAVMLVNNAGEAWTSFSDLLKGTGSHDLVIGKVEPGDILLHQEQKRPGCSLFSRVTHEFKYRGDKLITAVVAKDNWSDDTGGDPQVISGGLGQTHVTVKVTSEPLRGFNHTIYVYGKK